MGLNPDNITLEKVSTSIILFDKNGIIVYVNPAFCEMTTFNCEEILGKNIKILKSNNNNRYLEKEVWSAIRSGKEWKGEIINKTKNGEHINTLTIVSPVKNISGEITHFIGTKEDIAAIKRYDKIQKDLERLSSLGSIAAILLHELKSHYAVIKMNLNLIKPKSKAEKNNYTIIKKDLEKLNKYFLNILQYLKNKEIDMTNLNIHDVIDNSFLFIKSFIAEKKIQFINNVTPEIIVGDYQKILSVFRNLFDNAIDAIESEGKIEVWSETGDEYIKIFFKDTGSGIANPDRLFEAFYSTKSGGSGLGLTIAKRVIAKHNGSIELLKSIKGETIFEINFPR